MRWHDKLFKPPNVHLHYSDPLLKFRTQQYAHISFVITARNTWNVAALVSSVSPRIEMSKKRSRRVSTNLEDGDSEDEKEIKVMANIKVIIKVLV